MSLEKSYLTWSIVEGLADLTADKISEHPTLFDRKHLKIYGVPRGGCLAAQAVCHRLRGNRRWSEGVVLTEDPAEAHAFVDDIVDSGATRKHLCAKYPNRPFFALINKDQKTDNGWVVFPWEVQHEEGPENNVLRLLEYIGEDVNREGLKETPARVVRSYSQLFGGYKIDPLQYFKTFEDNPPDEMVVVRDIEFFSTCEHHMLPFHGVAHVAYVPHGKVIGLSKIPRIVDCFARRMQLQERLTQEIATCLYNGLCPRGVAVVIKAKHLCMVARGVQKQQASMVTSSLLGCFRDQTVRAEFLSLIQ